MAEQLLTVTNSKLTYASLVKMQALIYKYINIRSYLANYFTNITSSSTEWNDLIVICKEYLEEDLNWIGSSPSSTNSDVIKSLSSNQVNVISLRQLYSELQSKITISNTVNFDSKSTWLNILNKIIQILNLDREYVIHRQIFNAVKDSTGTTEKSPEQLSVYDTCEIPLGNNDNIYSEANYYAIRNILTEEDYYLNFSVKSLNYMSWVDFNYLDNNLTTVSISETPYTHDVDVGCVLLAKRSDGQYLDTIDFSNSKTMSISGADIGTTDLKLFELKVGTVSPTGDADTGSISTPIVVSPD